MGNVFTKIIVCEIVAFAVLSSASSSDNIRALEAQVNHFKEIEAFWTDKVAQSEQKLADERALLAIPCARRFEQNCRVTDECCFDEKEFPGSCEDLEGRDIKIKNNDGSCRG